MSSKTKTLVVLDTHAIIHRAYHALPDFRTSDGQPTGALYGVCLMLFSLYEKLSPDFIVAAYDLPGGTFRHETYTEYKAGRKKSDPELIEQLISSRELLGKLNIPIYDAPGFEADDIIGTISEMMKSEPNLNVIIASGDMDTLQLVDGDKVQVFTLKRGIKDTILYNQDRVLERFQFEPKLLIDYKGLRGDASDNIKGIAGIGEKTATTLITKLGDLDEIYKALDEQEDEDLIAQGIKKRTLKLLREGKEDAFFSKMLATIRLDAPVEFSVPEEEWKTSVEKDELREYFIGLEFRGLLPKVDSIFGPAEPLEDNTPPSPEKMEELKVKAWIVEPDKVNPKESDILLISGETLWKNVESALDQKIKDADMVEVYEHIEKPLIPVVAKMKATGIKVDVSHLKKASEGMHKQLDELQKEMYQLAGREFNQRSPKQLSEVLFDELGISTKGLKKTKTGSRSTKESELIKIKDEHPIINFILKYRELHKLTSTYLDALPGHVKEDGRIHSDLLQYGTSTGRFSSQNPNLQNIPSKEEHKHLVRDAFTASKGYKLIAIDYSQIELRFAAIMAKDQFLTDVFTSGGDIHAAVAAKMFNVSEDEVTKDMRKKAKVVNFGVLYGMGARALKLNLGCTLKEAEEYLQKYFEEFSTVKEFLEETKASARETNFTKTMFGRKRYYKNLNSHLPFLRAADERVAINAPIQGSATGDTIKLAMIQIDNLIKEKYQNEEVRMLLQVHDEIVFEAKEEILDEAVEVLTSAMESVLKNSPFDIDTKVPLLVNASTGDKWGSI